MDRVINLGKRFPNPLRVSGYPGERKRCLELGLLVAILTLATFLRIYNIGGRFLYDYDEGVYMMSASMMLEGYKLFSEIFSSQPPLFVTSMAVTFSFLGRSLAATRLVSIVTSIIAVLSCYLIARRISGPLAGLTSALLLSISPYFLFYSRASMAEVPSIGLAMMSIYLYSEHIQSAKSRDLLLCGIFFSLATLMKLFAACLFPIFLLGLVLRRRLRAAPFFLLGAALPLLMIPYFGTGKVVDQMYTFHTHKPETARLVQRLGTAADFLWADAGMFVLALAGTVVCLVWSGFDGRFMVAATYFMLAVLLLYRSLFSHHLAILLPPLAVLAGAGLGRLGTFLSEQLYPAGRVMRNRAPLALVILLIVCLTMFYASGVEGLLEKDITIVEKRNVGWYLAEVVPLIQRFCGPDDFMVTDQQGLAFIAQRKIPPDMCDTSNMRISSGFLDSATAIRSLDDNDVKVVVLWTGRLTRLEEFVSFVNEQFSIVGDYGAGRRVYARTKNLQLR